jgi:hypothetical protein
MLSLTGVSGDNLRGLSTDEMPDALVGLRSGKVAVRLVVDLDA